VNVGISCGLHSTRVGCNKAVHVFGVGVFDDGC
jgi:hypothetical protein